MKDRYYLIITILLYIASLWIIITTEYWNLVTNSAVFILIILGTAIGLIGIFKDLW